LRSDFQEPEVNQEEVQHAVTDFLALIVRGVTLRRPVAIKAHQHQEVLFISALLAPDANLDDQEFQVDLGLLGCRSFIISPATQIVVMDFGGEWPPAKAMREIDARFVEVERVLQ
jgi:hypothetical protein